MSDLISREVAINALNILSEKMTPEGQTVMEQAIAVLNDIYSAERTAKVETNFTFINDGTGIVNIAFPYKCGNCGCWFRVDMEINYCPQCGAKLNWGNDEDAR